MWFAVPNQKTHTQWATITSAYEQIESIKWKIGFACDFQRNEAGGNELVRIEECVEPQSAFCSTWLRLWYCYVKIAVRRRAGGAWVGRGRKRDDGPPPSRTLDVSGRTLQRSRKVSGRGAFARMTLQFSIGNENGIALNRQLLFTIPTKEINYLFYLAAPHCAPSEAAVAGIWLPLTHSHSVSWLLLKMWERRTAGPFYMSYTWEQFLD